MAKAKKRSGSAGRVVQPKPRCCDSTPRCKRCPVVCQRLAKAGLAEPRADGRYALDAALRKRDLKAARRRNGPVS